MAQSRYVSGWLPALPAYPAQSLSSKMMYTLAFSRSIRSVSPLQLKSHDFAKSISCLTEFQTWSISTPERTLDPNHYADITYSLSEFDILQLQWCEARSIAYLPG